MTSTRMITLVDCWGWGGGGHICLLFFCLLFLIKTFLVFSMVILSLLLRQEGQLSVSGKRMYTSTG